MRPVQIVNRFLNDEMITTIFQIKYGVYFQDPFGEIRLKFSELRSSFHRHGQYGLGNFTIQYRSVSNPVRFNTILRTKN